MSYYYCANLFYGVQVEYDGDIEDINLPKGIVYTHVGDLDNTFILVDASHEEAECGCVYRFDIEDHSEWILDLIETAHKCGLTIVGKIGWRISCSMY